MTDRLQPFRDIAATCTEQEAQDILDDLDDDHHLGDVSEIRKFYSDRVSQLQSRQREVEHYESLYEGEAS